jgi:hypothetical protein
MTQQINLYEERLRPSTSLVTGRNLGLATLAVSSVIAVQAVFVGIEANKKIEAAAAVNKQLQAEQETLSALTQRAAQRQISPELISELDNAKAMLAGRSEVIAVLDAGKLGNSSGFSVFMSGFARQASVDLWLTGFEVADGGDEIEIRGRLLDPAKLPLYVQRLGSEPIFRGRSFAALEMRSVEPVASTPDADAPATPRPGQKSTAGVAESRLPRFVEFVLRSQSAVSPPLNPAAGAQP